MATYFHGASEIQADGLQTLYLMNPGYVGYSDTQPPANMVFLNSAGNTLNPANFSHAPPQNHHLAGFPAPAMASAAGLQDPYLHGFIPPVHYNLSTSIDPPTAAGNHQTHRQHQIPATNSVVSTSQHGLSLSLSPQQPGYGSFLPEHGVPERAPAPEFSPASGSPSSASAVSNGISGMQSVILGSKYLKAAQQLLDEVVNVRKEIETESPKRTKESTAATSEGSSGGEASAKHGAELAMAERQELQMKKAKLVSMLHEVEQRYRQYHHQMQIVVTSFEQVAGSGSGSVKTYTALALQTISKQFRCLKDAISGQIQATGKSLGEEDCLGGKVGGSRLRFVDHQLRQQRALQQLGMIQHNAWRPQRGLPEKSVTVLRAWLFQHFLHPYPKDSDKIFLAKQTGLTRSQVSNWFINARVRLWKPMVEEMYMEEIKDQEKNGSEDETRKSELNDDSSTAPPENSSLRTESFKSKEDTGANQNASPTAISNSTVSTSHIGGNIQSSQAVFSPTGSSDVEGIIQVNPKKPRSSESQNFLTGIPLMDMDVKPGVTNRELWGKLGNERQTSDGYSLTTGVQNHGGVYGGYSIGEIGRFDPEQFEPRFSGNSVSLTLGLPHSENLSLSGNQQPYLSNQNILWPILPLAASSAYLCELKLMYGLLLHHSCLLLKFWWTPEMGAWASTRENPKLPDIELSDPI
ncbi:hypothetical protein HHK36_011480 [Tetracentron sinense]|uniref:Homeobox domain-containing protein n=1 Tax=Tetracentron sinense TaxID=13715 RepID=A0A835DH88_TETSI|nr:hypothetical protein HHK36_011480 [Tetracentron sinense]